MSKGSGPIDLAAFFGLSDEEASGLGLEPPEQVAPEAAPRHASAVTATAEDALDPRADVPPAVAITAIPGDTGTGEPGEIDPLALAAGNAAAGIEALSLTAAGELPEHAEQLPWPIEEELPAGEPQAAPSFSDPPHGARPWLPMPVLPVRAEPPADQDRAALGSGVVISVAPAVPEPAVPPAAAQPPAAVTGTALSPMAQELMNVFMEEAAELLDSLHAALESLERAPAMDALIEARRAVHTIKGGARMCGLHALTDLAHTCEDLIEPATAGTGVLPTDHLGALFAAEQEMRAALVAPAIGSGSDASVHARTARLRALVADQTPPAEQPDITPAETDATDQAAAGETIETPAVSAATPPPAAGGKGASLLRRPVIQSVSPQGHRLAVDLDKVEEIVAKVTEIVANRAASHGLMESLRTTVTDSMRTAQRLQSVVTQLQHQIVASGVDATAAQDAEELALETYGPVRQALLQLQEAVGDQQALVQATMDLVTNRQALAAAETRLDTDLQGALLNMRLMPVGQLRVRLDQVVRSTAAMAGREVRWTMEGQQVALDKQVCDRLFEPLLHLMRNAVDHGIEPPEEREQNGKSRAGHIVVQAQVEGNQAGIVVSDDGRGMDPARIAQVAIARGVITEEQARRLSDREKLELIFRPGFSTAQAVTEVSGRGMGMEIVREACIRMGGTVTISPRIGGGTVVTLQVPLSLSVAHALIVRDGARLLAVPAAQVLSVHLVPSVAVVTHENGSVVHIGREEIPLYRLPAEPMQGRRRS
ncbi:MAG TPA: ATP-binding protein, partial [Chloroflexota bacterium]|nr:ATP-binding protein [Chloroflexota bacterium]